MHDAIIQAIERLYEYGGGVSTSWWQGNRNERPAMYVLVKSRGDFFYPLHYLGDMGVFEEMTSRHDTHSKHRLRIFLGSFIHNDKYVYESFHSRKSILQVNYSNTR